MPQQARSEPAFSFTVEDVFYIKPPVDRVILVGTVNEGSVKAGDSLKVRCQGGEVSVVLEGIDVFQQGEVQRASKGQQVGLKVRGIRQEQPSRGDQVVGNVP